MTRKMYITFGQSEEVYYCPHYKSAIYQEKINSLKNTIKELSEIISDLKSKVDSPDSINPATKSLQESQSTQSTPTQSLQISQTGILVAKIHQLLIYMKTENSMLLFMELKNALRILLVLFVSKLTWILLMVVFVMPISR